MQCQWRRLAGILGYRIPVDADVVQRSGLALHDGPAAQVGLDVGIMRRHHGDDGLA